MKYALALILALTTTSAFAQSYLYDGSSRGSYSWNRGYYTPGYQGSGRSALNWRGPESIPMRGWACRGGRCFTYDGDRIGRTWYRYGRQPSHYRWGGWRY